jgi:hypothetical protein
MQASVARREFWARERRWVRARERQGRGVERGSCGGFWALEVRRWSGEHRIWDEARNTLSAGVIAV